MHEAFRASDGTFGSPLIVVDLWEAGWKVSVNTVSRIMAQYGLVARPSRAHGSLTKSVVPGL